MKLAYLHNQGVANFDSHASNYNGEEGVPYSERGLQPEDAIVARDNTISVRDGERSSVASAEHSLMQQAAPGRIGSGSAASVSIDLEQEQARRHPNAAYVTEPTDEY